MNAYIEERTRRYRFGLVQEYMNEREHYCDVLEKARGGYTARSVLQPLLPCLGYGKGRHLARLAGAVVTLDRTEDRFEQKLDQLHQGPHK